MSASATQLIIYLVAGAISAVFTVGTFGYALDGWKRSTTAGRRVGLIVGLAGGCSVAIGSVLGQEVIAAIAAPPALLLSSERAMRLVAWLERRRGADTGTQWCVAVWLRAHRKPLTCRNSDAAALRELPTYQ